ncbi:histidine kinase [Alkalihalobacillus alcalophilus ATCC 27647 = CGMCC 1.3604]|nr:histidine kinase [Alkalihalobacillus alcalophilus ATCC 27647 = CGMCC 1.3604]
MFRILIDSLYDGLYVTDGEGRTLIINEAYERITGITADKIIGMHMSEMEKKGYISRSISLEVIRQKKAVTRMQRIANGRNAMVSGTPVFDTDGSMLMVVNIVRDMTDLFKMQTELEDLKEWQAEVDRYLPNSEKTTFIAEDEQSIAFLGMVQRVASSSATVCLMGETGVGKTRTASYIHEHSKRKEKPFVALNCGALSESLVEAELFGYVAGAFTGASAKGKKGLIEVANGGTLFLDEVGDLPLSVQVKLLKVLDELTFTPVGSTTSKQVDVRIIAATNRPLEELVAGGKFREDLYYRLTVVPLYIRPLRERPKEVQRLIRLYLKQLNDKHERHVILTDEVLRYLEAYSWPGNIRELKNVIEYLVVTSQTTYISVHQLPPNVIKEEQPHNINRSLKQAIENFEREKIEQALAFHKTTRAAAEALGISQSALVVKRKKWQSPS